MSRIVFTVLLCWFAVTPLLAEDPVYFVDPHLKAFVEEELWILDPTPTDMLGLTDLVRPLASTANDGVKDLTGLECALNLQTLNLRYHQVRDLWPLSGLTNLKTVILPGNMRISDLSPLSGLPYLETLDVTRNDISDISTLSGLNSLTWLSLHRNRISDISPLTQLTSLDFLDLRINPLNPEAYDTYIGQIEANNPGIWLAHDPRDCRRLLLESTVGGSVADPGEGAFTYERGSTVWIEAEADPGFVFVNFSGSCSVAQNPAVVTMDQDYEIWANFASVLDTIHVDGLGAENPVDEDGTREHPFSSIQEAINAATDGASVIVRPGTFHENIDFHGKHLRLTGIDPDDPKGAAFPVIHGEGTGPVVRFTRGEDPTCALVGFVITGGAGQQAGAIVCSGSSPTIANCLIVGNRATDPNGGAVYCADSKAALVNCTIADNDAGPQGGGVYVVDSNLVLTNSIVWGNMPAEMILRGESDSSVRYTNIAGGWPGEDNLDTDPLFVRRGYWADRSHPAIRLEPSDANAVWMEGDYHLKSQAGRWDALARICVPDEVTSPCIDSGDPTDPVAAEPSPNGGRVNLGAYGSASQASKSDRHEEDGAQS